TGGLFACPLTLELSDCWRVPIDEGGEALGPRLAGGSGAGGAGGAHTARPPPVDLQRESKENQWLGVSVKSQGAGGKIVDLRVRDELDGGEWKFCEGRPQGHDRFGFCQQGLAAAFSPDQHYILFGAPGTYNWKGLLFVTNIDSSDPDQLVYKSPDPTEKVPGAAGDVPQNSYLGSYAAPP
ncbi:ITA7 protein, partial [Chauna torquata]|nr:ITA7 protein [Chauna torquata]